MEWKWVKRIVLKYFFILLFESFNGGNGKFISLKSQIFIHSKLGGMRENEIRFNKFFIKTPKIDLYIQPLF